MGTITFKGKAPFELELCNLPTAKGEGENVLVTLPVLVTGNRQDVRVVMTIEGAEQLLAQLDPALKTAWRNQNIAKARHDR